MASQAIHHVSRSCTLLNDVLARDKNVILLAPHFIGLDMAGPVACPRTESSSACTANPGTLCSNTLFQRRERFGAIVVERMASLKPIIRCYPRGTALLLSAGPGHG